MAAEEDPRPVQTQFLCIGQQDDEVALDRSAGLDRPHSLQNGGDPGGIVGRAGGADHGVVMGHQHDGGLLAILARQHADQIDRLIVRGTGVAARTRQPLDRGRRQRSGLLADLKSQLRQAVVQIGSDPSMFRRADRVRGPGDLFDVRHGARGREGDGGRARRARLRRLGGPHRQQEGERQRSEQQGQPHERSSPIRAAVGPSQGRMARGRRQVAPPPPSSLVSR